MQNIHPLLDADKQRQARKYEKEKRLFGLLGSVISLAFILWYYFSGFSQQIANLEYAFIWIFLIYVVIFQILSTIIGLPLDYYSGYVHEHKWGFSNYTHKTWTLDQIKSFLVSLVLFPLLLGLLYWVFATFPDYWWLVAGVASALVSVVFVTLFPVVIAPIFNKYDPIDDESLVDQLTRILEKAGLKPGGFFRQDMSRQTKKENAFLAGLGKTRRVVMADNLLEHMSQSEISSVIAHEVGHYRYAHLPKNIVIGTAQQLVTFYLLDMILKKFFPEFLTSNIANLALFPMIGLIMGILSGFLFGPLNNWLSRIFERQADDCSLELYPEKDAFLGAMAGLANRNLSNAYPSWWVKWLYYSHPPIGERLSFAEEYSYD
ncbi:MAG: M48 family metallopeptidase [Candidatus Marinimicrobia bacterium]|jgi:STE24 endopeptidase|nr:M48 family metallopeptidase [Candidatus Neomarinimicrobiota bacterium]|tara:strand:+ start:814 stop:1938 length:1125 start_codon:yes stop_codon:yes gene_type:complete